MAKQVQMRRGTTAEHSSFTGAVGELTVDTTKDTVVVHDGATVGGKPMATKATTYSMAETDSTRFGFKNILINGDFRINQRGAVSKTATSSDYNYDRWFYNGTTLEQRIENLNYKPSIVYTLSGTNITTAQVTSPASGTWTVTVPTTATNVQLEEGSVATPFEQRPIGLELSLCQRYYINMVNSGINFKLAMPRCDNGVAVENFSTYTHGEMRIPPSFSWGGFVYDGHHSIPPAVAMYKRITEFAYGGSEARSSGGTLIFENANLDAEL